MPIKKVKIKFFYNYNIEQYNIEVPVITNEIISKLWSFIYFVISVFPLKPI